MGIGVSHPLALCDQATCNVGPGFGLSSFIMGQRAEQCGTAECSDKYNYGSMIEALHIGLVGTPSLDQKMNFFPSTALSTEAAAKWCGLPGPQKEWFEAQAADGETHGP